MALSTAWRLEQEAFYNGQDAYGALTDSINEAFKDYSLYLSRYVYNLNGCNAITWGNSADDVPQYLGCIVGMGTSIKTTAGQRVKYAHVFEVGGEEVILGVNEVAETMKKSTDIVPVLKTINNMIGAELTDVYFIYATGKYGAYRASTFPNIENVLALLQKDVLGGIADPEIKDCFKSFHALRLPLAATMIEQYRSVNKLLTSEAVKLETDIDMGQYKDLEKSKAHLASHVYKVLLSKERSSRALDQNNKLALVRLAYRVEAVYKKVKASGIKITDIADNVMVQAAKVGTGNSERLATVKELEHGAPGIHYTDFLVLDQKEGILICILCWALTGKKQYFVSAGYMYKDNYECSDIDMVFKCKNTLLEALEWFEEGNFDTAATTVTKFINSGGIQYLECSEDEDTDFVDIQEVIQYLLKECPEKSTNSLYRVAYDIVSKAKKRNRIVLSEKQIALIRKAYDMMTGRIEPKNNSDAEVQEIKDLCLKVSAAENLGLIKANAFVLKIVGTLKEKNYSRASEKQINIIKEALSKVEVTQSKKGTDNPDIFSHKPCEINIDKSKLVTKIKKDAALDASEFPDVTQISLELGLGLLGFSSDKQMGE